MNVKRITLDTNILVYSLDKDAGDKHLKAIGVIEYAINADCILTLQSLSEFYAVVTRKQGLSSKDALVQIQDWQTLFPIVSAEPATLQRAIIALQEHQLSFWDAMLWSTARDAGVNIILTEDFNTGGTIGGIRFDNPFII